VVPPAATRCTIGRSAARPDGERRSQLRIVALEVISPDFFKKPHQPEPVLEAA
jgi:hypothetical protein